METIWKFPLKITDGAQLVPMPKDAEVLCVDVQRGVICIWTLVESEAPTEIRKFRIYGTGHEMDINEDVVYIGSVQMLGGALVWHVFEVQR